MSNIYLIRHAQQIEDFAPEGQQEGPPLAPIGITQAEHLRDRLAATHEIQANALISSPLLRARTTAEIIAPALGLPVMVDEDFQEFRPGNRAGIADKDISDIFRLVDFEREPWRPVAPSGESWQQFVSRISGAFDRIARDYDGRSVVIVTHDGVICASFLRLTLVEIRERSVPPGFRPVLYQYNFDHQLVQKPLRRLAASRTHLDAGALQ